MRLIFSFIPCLFYTILSGGYLLAQPAYQFQNFTQKDGLASNYIFNMYQDHLGFIWIGTENGLNRFDGKNFLRFGFDPADDETLQDNWVRLITEDSDHNFWIATERGLHLLNKETGKIQRIRFKKHGHFIQKPISAFYEDPQKNLWTYILNEGLFQLKKPNENADIWVAEYFAFGDNDIDEIRSNGGFVIFLNDSDDEISILTHRGVKRVHISTKEEKKYLFSEMNILIKGDENFMSLPSRKGEINLMIDKNIYFIDIKKDPPHLVRTQTLNDLEEQLNTSSSGMGGNVDSIFFRIKRKITHLNFQNQIVDDLFPIDVKTLLKDRQENYWIGTNGGGLFLRQKRNDAFNLHTYDGVDSESIVPGQVRTLMEDNKGNLWAGILNQGLEQFEIGPNHQLHKINSIISGNATAYPLGIDRIIEVIVGTDNTIWIASLTNGLIRMDEEGKTFTVFAHSSDDSTSITENRTWALTQDKDGNIWVGTWITGLNKLDPNTGEIIHYRHNPQDANSLGSDNIRCLFVDHQNKLWIGTEDGVGYYDQRKKQFTHFKHDPEDPSSLSDNLVWAIYEDHKNNIWVGTNTGLNLFDADSSSFQRFYERDGLPDNTIYGILEDDQHLLWVSTENGLARKLPAKDQYNFRPFGLAHGLETVSFVPKAYLNSKYSEKLYFGSTDGILEVNPRLLQQDSIKPYFQLHSVSRFNTSADHKGIITDYFVHDKDEVVKLTYHDHSVTFSISDLNWIDQNTYQYEYQLQGLSEEWIPLDERMKITFNKLSAGSYILNVRAKSIENIYSEITRLVALKVVPPWWQTPLVWFIYIGVFLALVFFTYRYQLRRKLLEEEAIQLKALDETKSRFFTNISHEFRTPLTIISGMITQVHNDPDQWLDKGAKLIKRNSHQLLSLINQILDLRKLETNTLRLHLIHGDMVEYIQYIVNAFIPIAESNNIRIHFFPVIDTIHMDYDPEKMMQIFSNLLSNAIKYMNEDGGDIYVHLDQKQVEGKEVLAIQVKDTGRGISSEALPHIFDRFYQVQNFGQQKPYGSGIGLSLTKELVKLMEGEIRVESKDGEGTKFILSFPIRKHTAPNIMSADYLEIYIPSPLKMTSNLTEEVMADSSSKQSSNLPTLLIVEDNLDIQIYLKSCLEKHYQLLLANDGQEGIEMAIAHVPELIISDVMMPKKDGFEVCDILKNHELTSHIPIIILTAKSSFQSKLSGFKKGADAYLIKPFEPEELLVRLEQLFILRQKLQQRYGKVADLEELPESEAHKAEDEFLQKVRQVLLDNISEENFNIQRLSREMGIGRTQLQKKVKALTGQTIGTFMKQVKLHKAKELLQTTDLNVSEVSYEIGIGNPFYFSRIYKEMFGVSPKEEWKK